MSAPLVSKGAISPVEILRLKQRTVEARGQLNATSLAIPRAEAAVAEIRSKIRSPTPPSARGGQGAQRQTH
jgi:adhesin transport system membrane fusion protein